VEKEVKKVLKKHITGVSLFFALVFLIVGMIGGYVLYNITAEDEVGETKIELLGDEIININLGETYTEPGYTFIINGEDYSESVHTDGVVDSLKVGTYTINYYLNDDKFNITLTRVVNVLGGESNGE
jgi:hypothetical protein